MKRFCLLLVFFWFTSSITCAQDNIEFKGISLSMANQETTQADITPIKEINANWIAIVPYGFLKDHEVHYGSDYQWKGEKPEGIRKCVKIAHKDGLNVMIKPHVWIDHGTYTGDYTCDSDKIWKKFEKSYQAYILALVKIAVQEEVELFSIGTEWGKFVEKRPQFWQDLITEIRKTYKGKLVYAANWDDYQKVPFWNKLDYIGIDAYFPLSLIPNPKFSELIKSWKVIMPLIEQYASLKKKKVLFTEFGFKSTTHATVEPWQHKDEGKFSAKVQNMGFKSFFQTIWKKTWFKGGFIWKWFHNHKTAGGQGDKDFTPQNKLAAETIRFYYGKK